MKRPLASCVAISVCTAVVAIAVLPAVRAQQAPPVTFDVVSVKRSVGANGMFMRMAPGNITASNVPVRQLIRQAYGLQDFQVIGGPEWVASDRFDVEARFDPAAAGGLTGPPRIQAMLQNMLRDRFKLVAHTDTRQMPVLALVMARDDRRLGPQLMPSTVDCAALMGSLRRGGPADGRGSPPADGRRGGGPRPDGRGAPPPGAPFAPGERPQCGGRGGFGQMIAGGLTMAQFVTQLSQMTGRMVVDRTGLAGGYDIDLKWNPTADQLAVTPLPPGVELPPVDPSVPSLFTALEEQLGLGLDSDRAPVEVLVIDSIEQPTDN